jgi:peptide/nickel transport system ATP-binding protein
VPNTETDILLRVHNLVTAFDTDAGQLTAVDGVSFEVRRGRTLGIVGESGCGKSVTAMSIMRLLPQPMGKILGGEVLFDGRNLATVPAEDMRSIRGNRISMIFQEPMTALNPVHRIGKQICEVLTQHNEMSPDDAWQKAVEMLDKVGIPSPEIRATEYPHQLSGGMRQRVVIAIALACGPELVIADEPTTALDVTIQAQILQLINDLQRDLNMAVILITHDLGVIAETCDEVCVMYAGRIVERAPVREIFASPRHAYTQGLLNSIPRLDGVPKSELNIIEGMVPALSELKPGCRFAPRSGREHAPELLTDRPSVEEISPGHWVESCPVCTQA